MKSMVDGKYQIQVKITIRSKIFALLILNLVFFSGTVFANSAPVVTNVTAEQHVQDVLIRYDLSDANDDLCIVSVQGSDDNGLTWDVPVTTLSSDVGPNIPSGTGKHIIWHCQQDLPRIFGTQYKICVIADDGIETGSAVSPTFSIDTRQNAWCEGADINLNGNINFLDLALLAAYWLKVRTEPPPDMVFIPGGEFLMGDHHDGMSEALPVHAVFVDSFYMGRYEITHQQYCNYLNSAYMKGLVQVIGGAVYPTGGGRVYCSTTASSSYSCITWDGSSFGVVPAKEDHPMADVTWYGAAAYCNWRSQEEGYQQCYNLSTWECDFSKNGYRLPTEAEWEYAARGGEHSPYYRYPWGDNIDGSKANYSNSGDPYETGSYPWTTPVDYYPANGYGLYDMAGNVWDWCNDWYSATYYGSSPYDNPTGPAFGMGRVLRGGCWFFGADTCRIAIRFNIGPSGRSSSGGFRVVLGSG